MSLDERNYRVGGKGFLRIKEGILRRDPLLQPYFEKGEVRTARRHLNHFEELGLVRKTGSGPLIEYKVI